MNEPKQTMDEAIDSIVDSGIPQTESSPVEQETQVAVEGGSDPLKTESTQPTAPGTPASKELGPVPYDKFQEQIKRRQEIEQELKRTQDEQKLLSVLLDDPDTFKRYLQRRGYTDAEIRREFQKKGFDYEPRTNGTLAEKVLGRIYGERLKGAKPEDMDALNESVRLVEEVTKELLSREIKPLKDQASQRENQARVDDELRQAEDMSKEDGFDFEKEAIPAMQIILSDMQKADPRLTETPPSAIVLYERASRRLMRDKLKSNGRQEVRDEKKAVSKPLTPAGTSVQSKGKRVIRDEDLGDEIDAKGRELGIW